MSPTCTADEGVVLSLGESPDGASPTVPVRWCISTDVVERLALNGVAKPYVLIVICTDAGEQAEPRYLEVDRVMFPVSQMLAFVQFHRPGNHALFPVIVWTEHGKRPAYLQRNSHHNFEHYVFDRESGKIVLSQTMSVHGKSVGLAIDEHFFAPEPPSWETWWVNLWFSDAPLDQCAFRRRRILAYTLQPFAVMAWIVLRTAICLFGTLLCLLFATRGLAFAPLLHPFQYKISDAWKDVTNWGTRYDSALILKKTLTCQRDAHKISGHRRGCYDWELRSFWFIWAAFTPIVLVIGGLIGGLYGYSHYENWQLIVPGMFLIPASLAAVAGAVALAILLIGGVLGAVGPVLGFIFAPLGKWIDKKLAEAEQRKKELESAPVVEKPKQIDTWLASRLRRDLAAVTCTGGQIRVAVDALPQEHRTFSLRFSAFKAKICKPYRK